MRAIIQSYTPQECERIINGRQTIKVCKTAPKDTPFKVYMYCTSVKNMPLAKYVEVHKKTNGRIDCWHGKVIGEYVCDWIGEITPHFDIPQHINQYLHHYPAILGWNDCMSFEEMKSYLGNRKGRDLHISQLKIYDKPKELGEFVTVKCTHKSGSCSDCKTKPDCIKQITRPPHGWQYVEEEE